MGAPLADVAGHLLILAALAISAGGLLLWVARPAKS
jgi:hypothetical protein